MGAYLSKPVTEKISETGGNERIQYAATTMQGWRVNQEDAHNCIADFDDNCSFFAVYDGHGGSEVAQYAAQHLPLMLKANSSWLEGNFLKAIEDTFLEFDELLRTESVLKELKKMAGTVTQKREETVDDEDKQALYEEAAMPIETILQKYGIVLCRDRNSRQAAADVDESRVKVGRHILDEEEEEEKEKTDDEVQENGSNDSEQETNGKDQNGNALEEKCSDRQSEKSTEKTKKRVRESPLSSLGAKRSRSSQDVAVSLESQCMNSSNDRLVENCKEEVTNKNSETAEAVEATNIESEAVDPAEDNALASNTVADFGDESISPTDNPQPSAISEGQHAFSSDSEQSMDEDYNVEEELSEDEEEEESDIDEIVSENKTVTEAEEKEISLKCDETMYSCPPGDTPGEDSGTTACVAILFQDKIIVGNAGDSRAVLCRKGNAIELSADHKPEDDEERKRIEAAGGEISLDGRVNGGLNLSRALGDHFYKKNNALPLKEQMISAFPDVKVYEITEDDEFIIVACDGIWNSLTSQEAVCFVRQLINDDISLKEICEKICDHCLSPNTAGDGTGCDNMTVIVAQIKRTALSSQPSSSSSL